MNKISIKKYFVNLGFLLYFVILGLERFIAIILTYSKTKYCFYSGGAFSYYVHILTLLSLIAAFVFINKQFVQMIRCAFSFKEEEHDKLNYLRLAIGSGILLLGGMVHTNYTNLYIQFVSYAFLILSMVFLTIQENENKEKRVKIWTDFAFLVSFAMAIPVAYLIKNEQNKVFLETYQCIGSFLLVALFTFNLYMFYKNNAQIKYHFISLLILLTFDLPIFILRIGEEVNLFLIIFPILCFASIGVYYILKDKSQNNS